MRFFLLAGVFRRQTAQLSLHFLPFAPSFVCSLEQDIVDLSRPDMDAQVKAMLASRMARLYECLTFSPQRLLTVR